MGHPGDSYPPILVHNSARGSSGFSFASSRRISFERSSATFGVDGVDLDDFIAALTFVDRRRHALLAQAQFLSTLRARRNAQQRAAIDGRHLNLRAQRGFGEGDWHGQVNVVAFALEDRMLAHAHDDVQIAGGSAHACRHCRGPAGGCAGRRGCPALMRTFSDSLRSTRPSPWQTGQTVRFLPLPPQRGQVTLNFMLPLFCVICPFAVALRTFAGLFDEALAVAIAADLEPRDVELQLGALDRLPEADVHLVFQIGAGLADAASASTPPPRPKMLEKMSRNPPPVPARRPAAPAPSAKSLKSKPLKSKGTSWV